MAEKKVKAEKKIVATAGAFDVLRRPIITEKAAKLSEKNGVAFEVAANATKEDVARAVKAIYNVEPTKVNIVVAKGKVKYFRGSRLVLINKSETKADEWADLVIHDSIGKVLKAALDAKI